MPKVHHPQPLRVLLLTSLPLLFLTLTTACGQEAKPAAGGVPAAPATPATPAAPPAPETATPGPGAASMTGAVSGSPGDSEPGGKPQQEASGQLDAPAVGATPSPQPPELPGGLAVIIENSPAARPQSGLDVADLVYEAEAEGGITRFLALFYSRGAGAIGPVRSVRTYFVDLAAPWGIPLAHAGGNASGLRRIDSAGVPHLDALKRLWEPYFWRSSDRKPPHNLYTSTELLLRAVRTHQLPLEPVHPGPGAEAPAGGQPVQGLSLRYGTDYVVRYQWTGRRWRRYLGDEPHTMAAGTVPEPANVLVVAPLGRWVPVTGEVDPIELALDWQGGGTALLFRDGQLWEGRWSKGGPRDSLQFWLGDEPWSLASGPTWVQVVHSLADVSTEAAAQ